MGGLFGGKKASTHTTRAMGIDFQGSQYGPVISVVYGQAKVPGNCIWYGDFASQAQKQQGGKGGGGKGGGATYTYSASLQMGLCEGPITSLVNIYSGNATVVPSSISANVSLGTVGQAAWSHLTGSAALGYSMTAIVSVANLQLGSSPSLPNYNYEVAALKQFGGGVLDANPSDILSDICTDTNHGVPFPYLGSLTQYSNYCVANGLFLSPVYDQQQDATQALGDLLKYTNTMAYYSDDQLKIVPLGDIAVTGNGVTYTPNITPVVALGQADFIVSDTASPISVERKAPQDCLNLVRIEYQDRTNSYHTTGVVASIDEDMIVNGARSDTSETVDMCKLAPAARLIAQNMVQRAFYIRNTYTFTLGWRYCYLEPTDIVTLTDATLGLNAYAVRILSVEEDDQGLLTITAEEFPLGVGHAPQYNTQANNATSYNPLSDPGAVNPPYLFRGPGFLVNNNGPEIWCAVNGSGTWWAAADVYLSSDNTSFHKIGTVAQPARYGSLNNTLPLVADPDTTSTPQVSVYAPAQLLGSTQADADNFSTLAMVDTEIVSYETATLVSAGIYNLSYLRRGGYGSTIAAHSASAPFVRLDDAIFRIPVDPSQIGTTVYLKFLSINAFGQTPRTLSGETSYSYVIGSNVELPDIPPTPSSIVVTPVADGVNIGWTNTNAPAVGATSVEYSTTSGGTYTVLGQVGPTGNTFHHAFTTGATYWYRLRARGPLVQSGWSAYSTPVNSTGKTSLPVAGLNMVANPGFESNQIGTALNTNIVVGAPITDGWTVTQRDSTYQCHISNVAGRFNGGAQALEFVIGNGDVIPTGLSGITVQSAAPFPVVAGSVLQVGGMARWYADYTHASLTATMAITAQFYTQSGSSAGTLAWSTTAAPGAYASQSVSGVVPTTAVSAVLQLSFIANNTSGSAITTTSGHYLGVPDFDDLFVYQQVANQINMPPIGIGSINSRWDSSFSLTSTYTTATPAVVTISFGACTLQMGNQTIAYSATSSTVSQARSTTITYYTYFLDPAFTGGSKTLNITTDPNALATNNAVIWVGQIAVTVPASGSGSGGGGGSGGGCVDVACWLPSGQRAGHVEEGDVIELCDHATLETISHEVLATGISIQPCLRLVTASGASVTASESTPMTLLDGSTAMFTDMLGREVMVLRNDVSDWESVVELTDAGMRPVNYIHVDDQCYWAGDQPDVFISTHNTFKP